MKKYRNVNNVANNRRIVFKPDYRNLGAILLFVFLLPYIISVICGNAGKGYDSDETAIEGISLDQKTQMFEEDWRNAEYIVCNTTAAGVEKMPIETYLTCRLPATISMDNEPETLKAQTVILRTELLKIYYDNIETNQMNTDNKKYIYIKSNVTMTDGEAYNKCKDAVNSTRGMYMTYEGIPIKSPYFAVSAGKTRNGNEVFKNKEYPYLKSVMCERDFTAEEYIQNLQMSKTAFLLRLQEINPDITLENGKDLMDIIDIERDKAKYVTEVTIGNNRVTGEVFRTAFSLNSSCFTVEQEKNTIMDDVITIKTKGVGHGLGFCQYGANEAAKKGSDFIDILNYYFTDIMIEKTE